MKDFIPVPKSKKPKGVINEQKIDRFISAFNKAIRKNELQFGTSFCLNYPLDFFIPMLNDAEFAKTVKQAEKNGYILTRKSDNYQSTMYTLTPIE